MRITTVDARSDEPHEAGRFAEFVAVQAASMAALHAGPSTAWTTEELRAMRRTRTDFAYADRLAQVGDTAVGMLAVALPQQDNTEAALIMLHVLPQHRRRGVGSALLAEAEHIARRHGRSILQASTEYDAGAADVGEAFARQHGFALAQTVVASHLDLPADRAALAAMTRAGRDVAAYDLEVAWDRLPAHWLVDRAVLSARMSTDAPQGELTWSEEAWTAARVVEDVERVRAAGRRLLEVVARDVVTGRLVGFTRITVSTTDPDVGYQSDTLVLREARGHRLGLRMKATAALAFMQESPATRRLLTWNADDNLPMLAVNRRLGFVGDGIQREWERRLPDAR